MGKILSGSLRPPRTVPGGSVDESMFGVMDLLRQRRGVDFRAYQQSSIRRRLSAQMDRRGAANLTEYLDILKNEPGEVDALFKHLLVPTTAFFRNAETCQILQESVLPTLISDHAPEPAEPLRVWVPGCSSGEEAYSLAILLLESMDQMRVRRRVQIFGTDVVDDLLRRARLGIYRSDIEEGIPEDRLRTYFVKCNEGYKVAGIVRSLCTFAHHNLLADPPFCRLGLISCQNVLMYFDASRRNKLLQDFFYSLNPEGYLVLGACENIFGRGDIFRAIDRKHRIYQSTRSAARTALNHVRNHTESAMKTAIREHGSAKHALPSVQREIALQRMETSCAQQELRAFREDMSWMLTDLRKTQDELEHRVAARTHELQRANEALQRETEILRVREAQRRRIARDLHDGIGQELKGAIDLLTDLRRRLAKVSSAETKAVDRLLELIRNAGARTEALTTANSSVPEYDVESTEPDRQV